MPMKNQQFDFDEFNFTIESVDKRRIKRVKVSHNPDLKEDDS